jgi:NADH:ubiquinone oxidoreductase subunit E
MRRDEFIKIYMQENGVQKLAKMLNVTPATIHNVRKKYKIPNKKTRIVLS